MVVKKATGTGESKTWAFLAVLLSIIGVVIAFLTKKNDKYVMYYAKQSLVLFVTAICASVVSMIPIIGWFFIGPILSLAVLVLWIMGLLNALSGETKPIPIIGKLADKINI